MAEMCRITPLSYIIRKELKNYESCNKTLKIAGQR